MTKYQRVSEILSELKNEMLRAKIWSDIKPSDDAFNSRQPFCYDTMTFEDWLQYVLIDRLKAIIVMKKELPVSSGVAEMAQQVWASDVKAKAGVIDVLACLDVLLSRKLQ